MMQFVGHNKSEIELLKLQLTDLIGRMHQEENELGTLKRAIGIGGVSPGSIGAKTPFNSITGGTDGNGNGNGNGNSNGHGNANGYANKSSIPPDDTKSSFNWQSMLFRSSTNAQQQEEEEEGQDLKELEISDHPPSSTASQQGQEMELTPTSTPPSPPPSPTPTPTSATTSATTTTSNSSQQQKQQQKQQQQEQKQQVGSSLSCFYNTYESERRPLPTS